MVLVSAWTAFLANDYYLRWFAWPQILFTAQVPLLVAIASVAFFFALRRRSSYWPFLIALSLFALGLIGLGVSLFPYVVPRSITIWEAAAPAESLIFMLVGAVVMVPVILAYTGYAYWVFRGKTGHEGYH
jgi:cytochrome d ubiquinol oxidase subunit II